MVGTPPVGITSGNFNGDGNLDLAVANNSFVSILLGVGNGTFLPAMNINIGDSPLLGILAADFNGDGKLDLAVTNDAPGNDVSVLHGNGDKKLDLVVANEFSQNISVLLGNGDGTFQ